MGDAAAAAAGKAAASGKASGKAAASGKAKGAGKAAISEQLGALAEMLDVVPLAVRMAFVMSGSLHFQAACTWGAASLFFTACCFRRRCPPCLSA